MSIFLGYETSSGETGFGCFLWASCCSLGYVVPYKNFLLVGVWITSGPVASEFHSSFFLFAIQAVTFPPAEIRFWGLFFLFCCSTVTFIDLWGLPPTCALSVYQSHTFTHRHASQMTAHWEAKRGDTTRASRRGSAGSHVTWAAETYRALQWELTLIKQELKGQQKQNSDIFNCF